VNAAPATAAEVLDFWFGEPPAQSPRGEWFRKDAGFDAQIQARFGATLEAALAGQLQGWTASSEGTLALIVVLDQFTRNISRNPGRDAAAAFAGDPQALALAQALVASGGHRDLLPLQRWFAYLPFEHAEDMAAQRQSMQLFTTLAAEHPALADATHWAQKHHDVVARFGRYPHRNAALGRVSTAEEEAFLREPSSSF